MKGLHDQPLHTRTSPRFDFEGGNHLRRHRLRSQLTSLIRLFYGDRTQSYSHAHSDAGSSCLALYDLQPVTDHAKNQPHETKQPS